MEFLLLRAAKLLEEGLVLFFPVDGSGMPILAKAYAAMKPINPEDIALILNPAAFNPGIPDEDIACDEEGEPIFWSFARVLCVSDRALLARPSPSPSPSSIAKQFRWVE